MFEFCFGHLITLVSREQVTLLCVFTQEATFQLHSLPVLNMHIYIYIIHVLKVKICCCAGQHYCYQHVHVVHNVTGTYLDHSQFSAYCLDQFPFQFPGDFPVCLASRLPQRCSTGPQISCQHSCCSCFTVICCVVQKKLVCK